MAQFTSSQASAQFGGHVGQMLRTHPSPSSLDRGALERCIQACIDCAQACIGCADACLSEADIQKMVRCIRLNQDCANVCDATGKVLSRQTAYDPQIARPLLQACLEACRVCGTECQHHASAMEHCRVCAEACKSCEEACRALLQAA